MAQVIAVVWGLLVWANWYRWNATGPDADWIAFTVSSFALIPFFRPLPFLQAWVGHLGSLALLGVLGLAAVGAGSAGLAWLGSRRRSVRAVIEAIALGAAVGGFMAMGAGFAGLSFGAIAWAGTLCFAARGMWSMAGGIGGVARAWADAADSGVRWAALVPVLAVLIPLCGALAPETSIDAQLHHLAQPAVFASLHKVVAFSWNEFSWHPALAHMSFLHAFAVSGASLAKLVAYGWFLLLVVLVVDWASEYLSLRWAVLAGAGFALLPYVQLLAMRAYPDFATIGYTAIMMRGLASGSSGLRLTGLWAGLAAATKITGLLAPAVGVIGLLVVRAGWSAWIWCGAVSLFAVMPWCLRNLLASGNPIAPLVPGIIPTLGWDPASYARHLRDLEPMATEPMALPGIFMLFERAWNVSIRNTGVMDPMAGAGGWFLWLLPLLSIVRTRIGRIGWLVIAGLAVWMLMPRLVRYSMPLWPAATVAIAVAMRSLVGTGPVGRMFALMGLSILVFHLPLGIARQHRVASPEGVACGLESTDRYLARGYPEGMRTLEVRDWINAERGASRVLMLSPTGLWLTYGPGVLFQTLFDRPVIVQVAAESRSSGEIAKRLRQLRVGYTLYQPSAGFPLHRAYRTWEFDEASAVRWRAFWESRAVPVFSSGDRFVIHRFAAGDGRDGHALDGTLPGLDEQWLADEFYGDPARLLLIAESRNTAAAWEQLGGARLTKGNEAGALQAFSNARAAGRRSVATLSAVGFLSARMGRWGDAESALREALTVDPDRADVRATLEQVRAARRSR